MESRNNSSFTFPEMKFSNRYKQKDSRRSGLVPLRDRDYIKRTRRENEWSQEYYIIYNSYVLEDKDS
jgi:hypothetical protein